MSDHKQPIPSENDPAPVSHDASADKAPWQRPTLESLDIADSEVMLGSGGDGGPPATNLS